MDDGLILNLADDAGAVTRTSSAKKGGRWTDRLKTNRAAKRKVRMHDRHDDATVSQQRPKKKARIDNGASDQAKPAAADSAVTVPERFAVPGRTQVISSLFTSNPEVQNPTPSSHSKRPSRPSNAPLADSSSFLGLGLDPLIAMHLSAKMDIAKPTSIQRAALPALLSSSAGDTSYRDIFIQSQTGSGKTLSFLLPIIQDLLPLSTHSYIDRSIGTLAIIIAPTRELAKQISDVLELVLQLRLRPADETPDAEASGPRLTRWLVGGLLTGGSTRAHEKARLRKGCPILVATPGRLLDHLQNTSSFNVGKCRWLVLDEADRLMELGFEETIQGIIKGLEGRNKLALAAVEEGKSTEVGGWDWSRRRRTVLCSATIREDVQKLAGAALLNPIVIKGTPDDGPSHQDKSTGDATATLPPVVGTGKFTPPSQLSQKYVVVPLKLRLVTLVALLRSLLGQSRKNKGTKIIVFLSCTDSVDFHWRMLGGVMMGPNDIENKAASQDSQDSDGDSDVEDGKLGSSSRGHEQIALLSALLPDTSLYRLHGSLPLQTRLASLREFSGAPSADVTAAHSSVLLCTSVASRGLDLPLVRAVIQYDLPTEGGSTEYVHRVGRTARVGKGGEAWSFVAPSEVDWVTWVTDKMQGGVTNANSENKAAGKLDPVSMETVLRSGFGGRGSEFEERATDVQLSFERWILQDQAHLDMSRKAYLSHMRAYATHPSDEKHIFHIHHLHLGHLAKAFALREAPTAVTSAKARGTKSSARGTRKATSSRSADHPRERGKHGDWDGDRRVAEAEKRMESVVRAQGRLTKKGGKIVSSGISEFQVASEYDLEKLTQ